MFYGLYGKQVKNFSSSLKEFVLNFSNKSKGLNILKKLTKKKKIKSFEIFYFNQTFKKTLFIC